MRFWSKGLGRRCLELDCGTEDISVAGGQVHLAGKVKPPLSWKYTMTMDAEDWQAFFEIVVHPVILRYLIRPRRWGVALRAGCHLTIFFCKYFLYLLLVPLTRSSNRAERLPHDGKPPA